jgi:hypothetical protein
MGADIDINDFATFDLLKELEYATHDLFTKESEKKNQVAQTKIVGNSKDVRSPLHPGLQTGRSRKTTNLPATNNPKIKKK